VIASVIETCKLIGVEPYAHFPDVITRIADGLSQSRLEEHLPCA
jgi:transposase